MRDLPTGTVTFLFTDVEGSTKLLHELGSEAYAAALAEHRRLVREACAAEGGVEVDTQGDAFFVAFPTAPGALAAARSICERLQGPIRLRMGLHTGTPLLTEEGYIGPDVHRAARIASAGHGGQILVSSATAALLDGFPLADLGEHRLKDLAAPERIFQLGERAFPPLKSLNNTNLPLPADPLIGRKKELAELLHLLRDGARLLTVTGPGGIGKTRFALEVAAGLIEDFRDGVWWVGLAPVRDETLVLSAIGAAVGITGDPATELASKELLLLLDNFEQVVDAASQLAALQRTSAGLKILVTSREPLHVAGEREYPLAPLPESPAVELFRQRAEAVTPDFDADYRALVDLCERLDRLPLAIELAAARTKTFAIGDLLQRLDQRLPFLTSRRRDVDERQRTLRATIEWSYDLLDDADKRVFAALGVFAGSFDVDAALDVCAADVDALESLVDKSLLQRREDGRFFMLETIREYASELLDASTTAGDLRDRHLEHYLRVVGAGEAGLASERRDDALSELVHDENNVRAAIARACDTADAERALLLAGLNWRYWSTRSQIREGKQWLERALALEGETTTEARARALHGLGELELSAGGHERARVLLEEAVPLLRAVGDHRAVASATNHLANAHLLAGERAVARRLYEESLRLYRDAASDTGAAVVTMNLGFLAVLDARYDDAQSLLGDALGLHRRMSNRSGIADTLENLAFVSLRRGDVEAARRHLVEGLGIYASLSLGGVAGVVEALLLGAVVIADRGDLATSVQLQSACRALADASGYELSAAELELADEELTRARAIVDDEAFAVDWRHGEQLSRDAALELALRALD